MNFEYHWSVLVFADQNTVTTLSVMFAGRVERQRWRTSRPAGRAGAGAHTESEVAGGGGGHSCQMQSEKTDGRSGFGSTSLLRRLAAEHEPLSIVSGTGGASPVALLQRRSRRATFGFLNVAVFFPQLTADLQAASLMKPQP